MLKRKASRWLGILAVAAMAAAISGCASKAPAKKPAAKTAAAKPAPKPAVPALPPPDIGGDDFVNGQRYFTGDGVAQDYQRAEELFRKAAQRGHGYAQYSLGLMYDHGYGVKRDVAEAARWYQKAADGGDLRAVQRLATLGAAPAQRGAAGVSNLVTHAEGAEAEPALAPPAAESLPAGTELIRRPAPQAVAPLPPAAARSRPATRPPESAMTAVRPATPAAPPPPPPLAAAPAPSSPAEKRAPVSAPAAPAAAPVSVPASAPIPPASVPAVAAAPPPRPVTPVLSALPVKQAVSTMSPMTAQAISNYQTAMSTANYAMALRALEMAREAGEITALGLSETQSAEELARMAILAGDGSLAQVYLRQAAALGSVAAADALNRLSVTPDLRVLTAFLSRDGAPVAAPVEVMMPPPAGEPAAEPAKEDSSLLDRLFGGGR